MMKADVGLWRQRWLQGDCYVLTEDQDSNINYRVGITRRFERSVFA